MRTTILCVGKNEQDLAARKFLLQTRGYRVQLATTEGEVLLGAQRSDYADVKLLISVAGEFSEASILRMQAAVPHALPMVLEAEDSSPVAFLERIRLELLRLRTAA